jgi:SAM-dependent methyltransferase
MAAVGEHYERLLAPIYLWMAGGWEVALANGAADVAGLLPTAEGDLAVDLGAGFGMHALPLADAGWQVYAIDTSALLLQTLRSQAAGRAIVTVEADLLDFRGPVPGVAALVVCLGDTLTHLADEDDVARLLAQVREGLAPGGRFVATFRDYGSAAQGESRFIPVRSDAGRIHTCFLEALPTQMVVHDLVHERQGAGWTLRVSSYRKLRLAPARLLELAREAGLPGEITRGPRGMLRFDAVRAPAR